MYPERVNVLIDGQWRAGSDGHYAPIFNPATDTQIGQVACVTQQDLESALAATARGFDSWRVKSAHERYVYLNRVADLVEARKDAISQILTLENGKALAEASGEVQFCAEAIRWYAEEGKRAYGRAVPARSTRVQQLVLKEPVGPALGFAAWNFPAGNVALKIAAALAASCSIIVKPSNETPGTGAAIVECFHDAGLPAGVVGMVFGDSNLISDQLIASPIPKVVSLTGSTPVGKRLQRLAADTMKRCTMELGGHAPVLVFADADIDAALDKLVAAKYRNAGQVCTSPTRFYVHADVYERFLEGFVSRVQALVVGEGIAEGTQVGPLILERRLAAMTALVEDAVAKGATLLSGGKRLDRAGYFFAPTVLRDVPDSAEIMREEPFGPIASICSFTDYESVIKRANSLPLGLAAYVFTTSNSLAIRASNELDAGVVGVNHTSVHEAETPFGGVNESGYGHESGTEGLEAYLRTKFVTNAY